MELAAFCAGVLVVLAPLVVAVSVERMAQRGERVYLARHRDHSKVPDIRRAVDREGA